MRDYKAYDPLKLIALIRKGNDRAFSELYERYYPQLYFHALRRLRDSEAAKDIVHDIFTKIWEKRSELEISVGVSSYLYTAIRNKVIDHFSRLETRRGYEMDLQQILEVQTVETDRLVREKQLAEVIKNEIERLPPQVRKVFDLSRSQRMSHAEIGRKMHLSEQTVRGYVKSALRVLRFKLSGLGIVLFLLAAKFPS